MWGDEYREPTVADRIEAYRYSLKAKTSSNNIEEAKEEDVDFFTDMTPNVSRYESSFICPFLLKAVFYTFRYIFLAGKLKFMLAHPTQVLPQLAGWKSRTRPMSSQK